MMRKHFFNENFFETIDNEIKAYWLGFIVADGYINARGNTVGITLDISDENHLLKFLKDINSNLNKLTYNFTRFDENHPYTKHAHIRLFSKKMHQDLKNLGITNNKTQDLKELNIKFNNKLLNHFIRGFYDGDGCVFDTLIKYGKFKEKICYSAGFTFVGTFDFLTFINNSLPFQIKNLILDKRTKASYTLYICSKKRFKILEEFLYKDATIFLDRKKEKCEKIKTKLNSGSTTIPEMGVDSSESKQSTS